MNRELLKMQKLAGLITESQYKEKISETENVLDNWFKSLHLLRNSINDNDKKQSMAIIDQMLSTLRDTEDK